MLNVTKLICFIFFLLLFLLGCKNKGKEFDCINSTGKIIRKEPALSPFTKILLKDDIHLIFVKDSIQKVEVEGGKNLLPRVIITQIGDSLILEDRNYCDWVRDYNKEEIKIYVHGNPGIKLYNRGYGKVSGTISGDFFQVKSWSSETMEFQLDHLKFMWLETFKMGNSNLSGTCDSIMGFRHMTGRFDFRNMTYLKGFLYHDHGQGKSYIRADQYLLVSIYGTGDVVCVNTPEHYTIQQVGSGQFILQ